MGEGMGVGTRFGKFNSDPGHAVYTDNSPGAKLDRLSHWTGFQRHSVLTAGVNRQMPRPT